MEKETKSTLKKLFENEKNFEKEREIQNKKHIEENKQFEQESIRIFKEIIKPKMEEFGEVLSSQGKKFQIDEKYGLKFEYGERVGGDGNVNFTSNTYEKKITVEITPANFNHYGSIVYDLSEITGSFVELKLLGMVKSCIDKKTK